MTMDRIMAGEWAIEHPCRTCGKFVGCDDEGHERHTSWVMRDDRGMEIATIQQFRDGGHFYGTTRSDRTGPFFELETCKEVCIKMLEAGL